MHPFVTSNALFCPGYAGSNPSPSLKIHSVKCKIVTQFEDNVLCFLSGGAGQYALPCFQIWKFPWYFKVYTVKYTSDIVGNCKKFLYSFGIPNVTTAQSKYNCRYNFGQNNSYYIFLTMFEFQDVCIPRLFLFLIKYFLYSFIVIRFVFFVNIDIKLFLTFLV